MRATFPRPRAPKTRPYYVKLEYRVEAQNSRQAIDALTPGIRLNARTTVGVTRTAELQRTDVRRPWEAGNW